MLLQRPNSAKLQLFSAPLESGIRRVGGIDGPVSFTGPNASRLFMTNSDIASTTANELSLFKLESEVGSHAQPQSGGLYRDGDARRPPASGDGSDRPSGPSPIL